MNENLTILSLISIEGNLYIPKVPKKKKRGGVPPLHDRINGTTV